MSATWHWYFVPATQLREAYIRKAKVLCQPLHGCCPHHFKELLSRQPDHVGFHLNLHVLTFFATQVPLRGFGQSFSYCVPGPAPLRAG